jgi:membrane fusion protein, multidrug efflux system
LDRLHRPKSLPAKALLVTVLSAGALWSLAGADRVPADTPVGGEPALASSVVAGTSGPENTAFDGVVQAVRQTTLAAQVTGTVIALNVRPGDRVQAGQVLLRLDARAADQNAAASPAQ